MKKIPIITRDQTVIQTARDISCFFDSDFTLHYISDREDAIFFLNYEVPEVKILDYTDSELNCAEIAEVVRKDLWLHPGGIIALVENEKEKSDMEENQDPSILLVLTRKEFLRNFERLLCMLKHNANFLFNRRMQQYLSEYESGLLKCNNEPLDLILYANLLVSYLYNTNRIDKNGRYRLKTALIEMMLNALEHGNCGITYAQKTSWLENGGDILDFIANKNGDTAIANRKICLAYQIRPERTRISITDEGDGFDWRSQIEKKVQPGTHGMGIKMTANFVEKLAYNDKGNQVLFEIKNQEYTLNTIPAIFNAAEIVEYGAGTEVCHENDSNDDLFFILSGRLDVLSHDKLISSLSPKDIFIGEMSFLLDGRRSATVRAVKAVRLIKISKNEFMRLIRQNPHYGVFLAKLLAQRLSQLNLKYLQASEANDELVQITESIILD